MPSVEVSISIFHTYPWQGIDVIANENVIAVNLFSSFRLSFIPWGLF